MILDLKSGEEDERGTRLVEERIEKIIREEMRAAREEKDGEKFVFEDILEILL